jgi:hypothetical protein
MGIAKLIVPKIGSVAEFSTIEELAPSVFARITVGSVTGEAESYAAGTQYH